MAVTQSRDNRSIVAGADLTAKQFKFVKLDAAAKAVVAGDGEASFGVLLVPALSGNAATVTVSGKTMVECGGTIAVAASVAVDADGNAVTAATNDVIVGTAYEAGVDGQIIAIEISLAGNIAA